MDTPQECKSTKSTQVDEKSKTLSTENTCSLTPPQWKTSTMTPKVDMEQLRMMSLQALPSNPQPVKKKFMYEYSMPDNQHNSSSIHDGAITGTQDCQIGSTGTPSIVNQTQPINIGNNPICPNAIISPSGKDSIRPNSLCDDTTDRESVNCIVNQCSPGTWSKTLAAKLDDFRKVDGDLNQGISTDEFAPEADVGDTDFSEKFIKDVTKEECAQCLQVGTDIGDRHYYTHVRSIIICDNEPLSEIEATHPRVVDTFTNCHAYQLSLWQNKNKLKDIRFIGPLPYWTTPYFLMGLLMCMKHRLTKVFPFNTLNNTRYTWKATPILLSYRSKHGKLASISPNNIFRNDAKTLPEPAHEMIHMISKPDQWFGASFDIWIHVEIKQLSYPQEIVTSAEDRFITKVRKIIKGNDHHFNNISELVKEFGHLANESNYSSFPIQESATEVTQDSIRKTAMRHAALRKAINHKLAKVNETFNSRNGLPQLLSSPEEVNLSTAQLQQKKKDILWRNRQLHKTSPTFKTLKKPKNQTTTSVNTARETQWIKSTPYSKNSKTRSQEPRHPKQKESNPFGGLLNNENPVDWSRDQHRPTYYPHKNDADTQRHLQQWNPDKALLRDQQERMREIKEYPQEEQLYHLNRISNPHPNLIPALESERRRLEWVTERKREANHRTQTAHYYNYSTATQKPKYKSYRHNQEDLRSRMHNH